MSKLRIECGKIRGQRGFYLWFIGGEFEDCAGEFEGPFPTLLAAVEKARRISRKEKLRLKVYHEPVT